MRRPVADRADGNARDRYRQAGRQRAPVRVVAARSAAVPGRLLAAVAAARLRTAAGAVCPVRHYADRRIHPDADRLGYRIAAGVSAEIPSTRITEQCRRVRSDQVAVFTRDAFVGESGNSGTVHEMAELMAVPI